MIGRTAVVTGGTDGIGAATALELRRRGADVVVVGRSQAKADAVVERAAAMSAPGSLRAITADLALMANVESVARRLADELGHVDYLLGAAGILITRKDYTTEGIERDFAVGYLSRFGTLETLSQAGALDATSRVITIAASSPVVPSFAQIEFNDLAEVEARTGMKSHGQAQLANDLLTAQAAERYGVTAIGYGPGSVDTQIRREIPGFIRTVMRPFFARTTRSPEEVGAQLASIFADESIAPGGTYYFDRNGPFAMAAFVSETRRQQDLMRVSLALWDKAISARP